MIPAVYNPETVRDIRTRAQHGMRLGSLARHLGWDIGTLKRVAERHNIFIVEETATENAQRAAGKLIVEAPALSPAKPSQPTQEIPAPPAAALAPPVPPKAKPDRRLFRLPPSTAGSKHPVALNCRVSEEIGVAVYNFAARHQLSQLEAVRRLLVSGLECLADKPGEVPAP